jgi:hypothetical protein
LNRGDFRLRLSVRLRIFGKVKVDDDIDSLDIDTRSEEVGADEVATDSIAEVAEDTITMGLKLRLVELQKMMDC